MDLTTLANVKALLNISDNNLDSLITDMISSVSEQAASYCGRNFERQTFVEYHDGGAVKLFLENPPIYEVLSIYVDSDYEWNSEDEIPSEEYMVLNPRTGVVSSKYGCFGSINGVPGEVQVTYIGGYVAVDIPVDLEMAIRRQVAYLVRRRQDIGLSSTSFPDGYIQKVNTEEFLPEVMSVLERHSLIRIA
jgi:hypothetical protein